VSDQRTYHAAHVVMYAELLDGPQECFLIREHIILIASASNDEAWDKAEARAREMADAATIISVDGRPARMVLAGIRKLTACEDSPPGDLTEVTYLELSVADQDSLDRLAAGASVSAEVEVGFPEDVAP
jgi:hypothetical protein